MVIHRAFVVFFFNAPATTEIYTLSLHDALPISDAQVGDMNQQAAVGTTVALLERGSRVMSAIHKRQIGRAHV